MATAKRRGRPPTVATDTVIQTVFESDKGIVTGRQLAQIGVTVQRANALLSQGILTLRKGTVKNMDAEGNALRGRPSRQFGLSRKARNRAKKLAASA